MSYSFWCSKCKCDHAGECAVIEKYTRVDITHFILPSIGSKWVAQRAPTPEGPWTDMAPTEWTVLQVDQDAVKVFIKSFHGTQSWITGFYFRERGYVDGPGFSRYRPVP